MSELKLRDDILDELAYEPVVDSAHIGVAVDQKVVTLTGKVNWQYQKSSAEGAIRRLAGVRAVINNIEVEPHAEADNVKGKIEAALKRHAEVEARDIRVTVRDDSEVLLDGKVHSFGAKIAVENAAWSAPGVKSVKDRLIVVS